LKISVILSPEIISASQFSQAPTTEETTAFLNSFLVHVLAKLLLHVDFCVCWSEIAQLEMGTESFERLWNAVFLIL